MLFWYRYSPVLFTLFSDSNHHHHLYNNMHSDSTNRIHFRWVLACAPNNLFRIRAPFPAPSDQINERRYPLINSEHNCLSRSNSEHPGCNALIEGLEAFLLPHIGSDTRDPREAGCTWEGWGSLKTYCTHIERSADERAE